MTVDLYDHAPPNSIVFVISHLMPLATTPHKQDSIAAKRWSTGMPLPYRAVTRTTGNTDQLADYPHVRVHTFAATFTDAMREADRTHQRMLLLLDDPLYDVVMPDGSIANCESLTIIEGPHEEEYPASSVVTRFVAEYLPVLRLTPPA